MQLLQAAAVKIAAKTVGADEAELTAAVAAYEQGNVGDPIAGFSITDLVMLIEVIMGLVMELIEQCDNTNHAEVTAAHKVAQPAAAGAIQLGGTQRVPSGGVPLEQPPGSRGNWVTLCGRRLPIHRTRKSKRW